MSKALKDMTLSELQKGYEKGKVTDEEIEQHLLERIYNTVKQKNRGKSIMDIITILRKAINSEQYSEGLKDALEFLKTKDQGMAKFEEIVQSIEKDKDNE